MLDIQGLVVTRGNGAQTHTVSLPSLILGAGEICAITGESGCGKSTLLEVLALVLKPAHLDRFLLAGQDIAALIEQSSDTDLASVRSKSLGFVLQNGGLLPFLTVKQNIALPRKLQGLEPTCDAVEQAIDTLKLRPLLRKLPQALSIGERQRVACVRAISHAPHLMLADEPTSALDPHSARRLFELLLRLMGDLKLSALIVSHDWALVNDFGLPRLQAIDQPQGTRFEAA